MSVQEQNTERTESARPGECSTGRGRLGKHNYFCHIRILLSTALQQRTSQRSINKGAEDEMFLEYERPTDCFN